MLFFWAWLLAGIAWLFIGLAAFFLLDSSGYDAPISFYLFGPFLLIAAVVVLVKETVKW